MWSCKYIESMVASISAECRMHIIYLHRIVQYTYGILG